VPLALGSVEFVPVIKEELLPTALDEIVAEEFTPGESVEAVELVLEELEELLPVVFPAVADEFVELVPAGDMDDVVVIVVVEMELVPIGDVEFDPPTACPPVVPLVELLAPKPELVAFPPEDEAEVAVA
jgi:hypothetical protein